MNIYDVAKLSGVSPSTVSRVLNGTAKVSEPTRKKVEEAVEKLDYIPNQAARNLSTGENKNIAFIIPDIENPFFSKVLHGISSAAMAADYNVYMVGTDENSEVEHEKLRSLHRGMVCGVIIAPVSKNDQETADLLSLLIQEGIAVTLVDRDINTGRFDGVFSDDDSGAFQAVDLLIRSGHRKIGMITGPDTSKPGYERRKGYERALDYSHIPFRKEYLQSGSFRIEESFQAMKRLMEVSDPPTAVFTSNNHTTLGCLKYMKENHLTIGEDLSIVAFDDIPELSYTSVDLTVVDRSFFGMGSEAMSILMRRIKEMRDGTYNDSVLLRSIVKTQLIVRGSEKLRRFEEQNSKKDLT
ncbi:MAG: LacI family DNA-binding transcriptional regulator [Eubacteriales bacterium]|jgi:LacI family transcriptional regulator